MTELILIRHGETVWNQQRRLQGNSDSPLSGNGIRQAQQLAARLKDVEFDALYSSDSGRAQATARGVAELTGRELRLEPRLRERHFGVFEGLTGPEIEARYPADYVRFKSRDPDYAVPGGESAAAFRDRVTACLQELAARHQGERVVAVTHGLVLDVVYRAAHGMELLQPRSFEILNAGLNHCRFDGTAWFVDVWADGKHLLAEPAVE